MTDTGTTTITTLEERREARATKDWGRADALRERLTAAGIVVEDVAQGARWTIKDSHHGR